MLNDRLRERRNLLKLTQGEIAEKIHVALTTYANWEQGTRNPDLKTLPKLADIFGCSTDYLLGRTDNPYESLKQPSSDEALVIVSESTNIPIDLIKEYIDYLQSKNKK